jgi:hypothetical protein
MMTLSCRVISSGIALTIHTISHGKSISCQGLDSEVLDMGRA